MEVMLSLLLVAMVFWWLIAAVALGQTAADRGLGRWSWFLLALVLSPAFVALLLIASLTGRSQSEPSP